MTLHNNGIIQQMYIQTDFKYSEIISDMFSLLFVCNFKEIIIQNLQNNVGRQSHTDTVHVL